MNKSPLNAVLPWIKFGAFLGLACIGASSSAQSSSPETAAAPQDPPFSTLTKTWRPLLDEKLSAWEIWIGVPQKTVVDLPPGTSTSADGNRAKPLGLNNDPKHVYTTRRENGEVILHITGEIYGGLTSLEAFSNYHLRAEFRWGQTKWAPKLNAPRDNGILFHCTGPHGAFQKVWKRCLEFQVEEKDMGDLYCLAGTCADVIGKNKEPKSWIYDPTGNAQTIGEKCPLGNKAWHLAGDFEKPNGEWNVLELYTIGQTAVYVVNGHVDQVLRNTSILKGPDKREPLVGGQIQLQSEGAEADYRRVEICSLPEFPDEIKRAAGF